MYIFMSKKQQIIHYYCVIIYIFYSEIIIKLSNETGKYIEFIKD